MTPIGDIEIELVFPIAIRGRTRVLAELMRTLEDTQAVILLPLKKVPMLDESGNKRILVSIGRFEP